MNIRRGRKLARASKPSIWEVDAGAKEFKAILSYVGLRSVILSYETLSQKKKEEKEGKIGREGGRWESGKKKVGRGEQ